MHETLLPLLSDVDGPFCQSCNPTVDVGPSGQQEGRPGRMCLEPGTSAASGDLYTRFVVSAQHDTKLSQHAYTLLLMRQVFRWTS